MTAASRVLLMLLLLVPALANADQLRGTGSLGLVVERAAGSV
ncbi:MAG: protein nirF, partial [Bradyrhizobium icense]